MGVGGRRAGIQGGGSVLPARHTTAAGPCATRRPAGHLLPGLLRPVDSRRPWFCRRHSHHRNHNGTNN